MIIDNALLGVLDIDSPLVDRFDEEDRVGLEIFIDVLLRQGEWPMADRRA